MFFGFAGSICVHSCHSLKKVIIIMPCGYDIQKSIIEIKTLSKNKDWQKIRAVKNDKVFITDGNQYFNRPGPRLVESLEILVEILNFK